MSNGPHYKTSLERKFFTAIFWVGVIPMTLTLIVAYVFAREGQWVTTKRNLTTAIRRTTDGIRLSVASQVQHSAQLASDPDFVDLLLPGDDKESLQTKIRNKLQRLIDVSNGKTNAFAIVDTHKNVILATDRYAPIEPINQNWHTALSTPTIIALSTPPRTSEYLITIASPIRNTSDNHTLGFFLEIQDITDLLNFALSSTLQSEGLSFENIYYCLIYLHNNEGISIYRGDPPNNSKSRFSANYEVADPKLIRRLQRTNLKTEGFFTLWNFKSQGKILPALIAYQRLFPEYDLYFVAYKHLTEIFWFIHVGSVVALFVAGLVILLFSLIGYRIVHKNILRPLSLINEGAQIIRLGDLELKLKINTGDELEEVANSFNQMASALRKNIYELEKSEERYRNLINAMRDGIFQIDKEGKITFINPAGATILGFDSPEEAIGTPFESLFLNSKDYKSIIGELETNKFISQFRAWIKPRRKDILCLEFSASVQKKDQEQAMGIEGIFRDITQNVLLEKEVQDRAERLKAINIIARTINSSLEAGMVYETVVNEIKRLIPDIHYAVVAFPTSDPSNSSDLSDSSDVSDSSNRSNFHLIQIYPHHEQHTSTLPFKCGATVIHKRSTIHFDYLSAEDETIAKEFPENILSLIASPLFAEETIIGVLVLGSEIPKAFSPHHIEVVEELTPHIAVAIRNARLLERLQRTLDEVNQAREQLNKANEELKTLDEMKTNLLSNVSHELRTPLVSIMGYTDMILKGKAGPITETQREFLSVSIRNVEKLVNLIENLLDFSKLHKGKEDLIFSTFDIVECAESGLQNVRPMAELRNIQLILNAETKPIMVDGDKGKILQVFNNLLSNAVKFNKNNGKVEVRIKVIDDEAEISVIDTGIGIPPESLDKIFTRFYQVDTSSTRKYGGTGIGLSISQDIIRLHGSRITVTSKLGEGSQFSFRLPLHGKKAETLARYDKEVTPEETHLLVELVTQDRPLSAQIRNWLLEENIDIIHATYSDLAISLALRYNPDCIIVDCEEGVLGVSILEEFLQNPTCISIPIIIITDDDNLYHKYFDKVIHRLTRHFRKSSLLSAIRYATKYLPEEEIKVGTGILCVDDDPEILKFIELSLKNEGYFVDTCSNGEEALERVQSGKYGLVLLDIAMAGLDGWEVCKTIKSNPKLRGIKIHIITAKPIQLSHQKFAESGADGILQKPFKQDELISVVKSYLPSPSVETSYADPLPSS